MEPEGKQFRGSPLWIFCKDSDYVTLNVKIYLTYKFIWHHSSFLICIVEKRTRLGEEHVFKWAECPMTFTWSWNLLVNSWSCELSSSWKRSTSEMFLVAPEVALNMEQNQREAVEAARHTFTNSGTQARQVHSRSVAYHYWQLELVPADPCNHE